MKADLQACSHFGSSSTSGLAVALPCRSLSPQRPMAISEDSAKGAGDDAEAEEDEDQAARRPSGQDERSCEEGQVSFEIECAEIVDQEEDEGDGDSDHGTHTSAPEIVVKTEPPAAQAPAPPLHGRAEEGHAPAGAVQQPPINDADAVAVVWSWKAHKVAELPDTDKDMRDRLRMQALDVIDDKPTRLCSKLTCRVAKQGKQAWCSTHRKVYDNGKADAERQGKLDEFKAASAAGRNCAIMDEYIDEYILTVGLPGQQVGRMAGEFDFAQFRAEKFSSSTVEDADDFIKMDHVAFIRYQTIERLKSKAKAESEWAAAAADVDKFPGRDWEGPGECPTTLGCRRPECAGGKLRIHIFAVGRTTASTTKGRMHASVQATKQKRKFKEGDVQANNESLDFGHESFGDAGYKQFSKAVVASRNPFAQLESSAAGMDEVEDPTSGSGGRGSVAVSPGPKQFKKQRAASEVSVSPAKVLGSGGPSGGGGSAKQSTSASMSDQIDDAHTKAETDVRRAQAAFEEGVATASEALATIPEASYTARLRSALKVRLDAANFWSYDQQWMTTWSQEHASAKYGSDAWTHEHDEQYRKAVSSAMIALEKSILGADLTDFSSKADLHRSASIFASGCITPEMLETKKTEFQAQLEKFKEFARLLSKAAQRLKSTYTAEQKHLEFLEAKRKAEADKKRQAEIQKEQAATKKRRPLPEAAADAVAGVAAKAAAAKAAVTAKDLLKIDFKHFGHPGLRVNGEDNGRFEHFGGPGFDWNVPCIAAAFAGQGAQAPAIESTLFADPHGRYRGLLSAFRSGFKQAVKKVSDGRLGYGLPGPESPAFGEALRRLAGCDGVARDLPDVASAKHPNAEAEMAKTVQPHLYGYQAGTRHAGCEPRQISSLKFQIEGERFVVFVNIAALFEFLKTQPQFQATGITYSRARSYMKEMEVDRASKMGEAGVQLFHGVVSANTILFVPAGYMAVESVQQNNFGVRLQFCADFGPGCETPHSCLVRVAETLSSGPLSDEMEGHLAKVIAQQSIQFKAAHDHAQPPLPPPSEAAPLAPPPASPAPSVVAMPTSAVAGVPVVASASGGSSASSSNAEPTKDAAGRDPKPATMDADGTDTKKATTPAKSTPVKAAVKAAASKKGAKGVKKS